LASFFAVAKILTIRPGAAGSQQSAAQTLHNDL
jgi:hypothetical protein